MALCRTCPGEGGIDDNDIICWGCKFSDKEWGTNCRLLAEVMGDKTWYDLHEETFKRLIDERDQVRKVNELL